MFVFCILFSPTLRSPAAFFAAAARPDLVSLRQQSRSEIGCDRSHIGGLSHSDGYSALARLPA